MRRCRANLAAGSTSTSFAAGRRGFAQNNPLMWCFFGFLVDCTGFHGFTVHFLILVIGGVVLAVSVAVLLTFGTLSAVTLSRHCV